MKWISGLKPRFENLVQTWKWKIWKWEAEFQVLNLEKNRLKPGNGHFLVYFNKSTYSFLQHVLGEGLRAPRNRTFDLLEKEDGTLLSQLQACSFIQPCSLKIGHFWSSCQDVHLHFCCSQATEGFMWASPFTFLRWHCTNCIGAK